MHDRHSTYLESGEMMMNKQKVSLLQAESMKNLVNNRIQSILDNIPKHFFRSEMPNTERNFSASLSFETNFYLVIVSLPYKGTYISKTTKISIRLKIN